MLAEALRLFRIYHDMTLSELASKLGVTPSFVSAIENSKKKPSMELLQKYAAIFETTPAVILFFSEELNKKDIKSKVKSHLRKNIIKFMRALERAAE